MQDLILNVITPVTALLWGPWMLGALLLTGLGYTIYLRGLQFTMFGRAIKLMFRPAKHDANESGDISHFQALMTALSATVGTGNIAGVATAIAAGGPGAVFWMWLIGFLGMATKYAEAILGVYYREKLPDGSFIGGPMYYLTHGIKSPILGWAFAIVLCLGALGAGGMIQSNSIADILQTTFEIPAIFTGFIITSLAGLVMIGGVKRIGSLAEKIVPFMIILYMGTALIILVFNLPAIPAMLMMIVDHAFKPTAAAGGFLGATIQQTLQYGLARGAFSNEAGMGSAPIAAAVAKTKHPVEQALVSMLQTFIDTLMVCTTTAVIILISSKWTIGGDVDGATLTGHAFTSGLSYIDIAGLPLGAVIVSICLAFFVFSTIIGWGWYGVQGAIYAFGKNAKVPYLFVLLVAVFLGTIMQVKLAWAVVDLVIGLMIPLNLIGIWLLAPQVRKLSVDYFRSERTGKPYSVRPFRHFSAKDTD